MKTVFPTSEVPHLWANKIQSNARNSGGNLYFDNETIYSYGSHFPIATHYKNVVLFTLRSYSSTTASHIAQVKQACSHKDIVFCLHVLEAKSGQHSRNIAHWFNAIEEQAEKIVKARKPEIYVGSIEVLKSQLLQYVELFKIKLTKAQKQILDKTTSEEWKQWKSEYIALKDKQRKASEKRVSAILPKLREAWHNFKEGDLLKGLTEAERNTVKRHERETINENETFLRTDGTTIFTSKGITCPVEVGKRYYAFYKRILERGGCSGNCGYKMLDYEVIEANEKHLVVGCHDMAASEIELLAIKLGW